MLYEASALTAAEVGALGRATAKRRLDYANGRGYAREALAQLGHPPCSILRASTGAPIWPEGIQGSISHTGTRVGALLAPSTALRGIGLDFEDLQPVAIPDWAASDREVEMVGDGAECPRALAALLAFSLKEAALKAASAIVRHTIVDIALEACSRASFQARSRPLGFGAQAVVEGCFTIDHLTVSAAAWMPSTSRQEHGRTPAQVVACGMNNPR